MNKLQMKHCGDMGLRETSAPIVAITPELLKILDEMVELMREQQGAGLAAPQVGINGRFFVMMCKMGKEREPCVYKIINPNIVEKSSDMKKIEEGCLSVVNTDNVPIFADVERPASIIAEWMDETGAVFSKKLTGFAARVFQHEFDHLDGVLFIDYLSPVKREMVMRKVRKRK